jgi:integrase
MPTIKLTGRDIPSLQPIAGKRTDFFDKTLPGFSVRVSPSGRKSFCVLYRRGRRLRRLTIGRHPVLSLKEAREIARDALVEVARGGDPAARKVEERKAPTFAELANEYLERYAKPNKRSWSEDQRIIENKLNPVLGRILAKDVTRADVRRLLENIVRRPAPIEANRTHALLRKLYNWAISQDLVEQTPCFGLPRPAKERPRHHVLSEDDLRRFWEGLEAERCSTSAIFKLRLLTAQRGGEVHGMEWAHIDLESAWWTIPMEHSKNGLPHRVPLSSPAITLLKEVQEFSSSSKWVFPNKRGDSHVKTLQRAVERIRKRTGVDFRGHDLRRTAASFMTSMGTSRVVVARILNHAERGVTAVYDRHSYDQEKRRALDAWAKRLEELVRRRLEY